MSSEPESAEDQQQPEQQQQRQRQRQGQHDDDSEVRQQVDEDLEVRLRQEHGQHWARKARRRSSDGKVFVGDSLSLRDNSKVLALMNKNDEQNVFFSDTALKVNRKGRQQLRWLLITGGALYFLEPISAKLHHRIPLADISHISASLLPDNFFVVHVPTEYDFLLLSSRKTEVVTILRIAYFDAVRDELTIALQNVIDYRVDKDQQRRIVFQEADDAVYTQLLIRKSK